MGILSVAIFGSGLSGNAISFIRPMKVYNACVCAIFKCLTATLNQAKPAVQKKTIQTDGTVKNQFNLTAV